MTVQKKKKKKFLYSYSNCFWEAKLFKYIMENNEDNSFSVISVYVTYVIDLQCVEGLVYPLEELVLVDMFSHWDELRKVCTEECECVFVTGWVA